MLTQTDWAEITLTQTDSVRAVVRLLYKREPDWEKVVERFKKTQAFKSGGYLNDSSGISLSSYLSEAVVRVSLEDIAEETGIPIKFDPIAHNKTTTHYLFRHLENGLFADSRNKSGDTQLDELVVIDGLPTVIETTLAVYKSYYPDDVPKEKNGKSVKGTVSAFRSDTIEAKLAPVKEFFKEFFEIEDCCYVAVIDPEHVDPTLPEQKTLADKNGFIVPFPRGRVAFREEVREEVALRAKRYGLLQRSNL